MTIIEKEIIQNVQSVFNFQFIIKNKKFVLIINVQAI